MKKRPLVVAPPPPPWWCCSSIRDLLARRSRLERGLLAALGVAAAAMVVMAAALAGILVKMAAKLPNQNGAYILDQSRSTM